MTINGDQAEMINRLEIAGNYFKIPIVTIFSDVKNIINNK